MADPNHGRDIEADILRVLAEADGPVPYAALDAALPSKTAVTMGVARLEQRQWIERSWPAGQVVTDWQLTAEGRREAEARGLTGRTEQ